ncbi:MAG: ABC transporter ATP-binding protein [Thermoproteota archaeon]|nr:ABC transporter ATP-binding protein [Thermoproteota archaeon]
MLKMENLSVKVHGKDILQKISLEIKNAEVHALLGPNASGKSTLAYAVMGFPEYNITEGTVCFKGRDITDLPMEERVKLGIALAFQHPPAIKGVTLSKLLEKISKQTLNIKKFSITPNLLEREINVGFSGGERKLSEIIQIISLNPSFAIFDELDAGLDIVNLKRLTSVIQDKLLSNDVSILMITHRGNILHFLEPDVVHIMLDGEIVCSSEDWRKVWRTITRYGYEKCKECKFRSG